jgi:hypothetical protein
LKTTNEEIEKNVENDLAVRSGRTLAEYTGDCYLRAAIRLLRLLKPKPRLPNAQATIKGNQEMPFQKRNATKRGQKRKVTSPTLGTGGKRLWLLRSRPDQVDRASMRGGPSHEILPSLLGARDS